MQPWSSYSKLRMPFFCCSHYHLLQTGTGLFVTATIICLTCKCVTVSHRVLCLSFFISRPVIRLVVCGLHCAHLCVALDPRSAPLDWHSGFEMLQAAMRIVYNNVPMTNKGLHDQQTSSHPQPTAKNMTSLTLSLEPRAILNAHV